jgi:hypothetical protein
MKESGPQFFSLVKPMSVFHMASSASGEAVFIKERTRFSGFKV